MRYDQERVGDVRVIRIREKKLTSHEAPEMKTKFLELIIREGDKLLVNLKDVENMDSTGLGSVLLGVRQAEQHGKDLRFCEIQPKVQFLIRIAHLEQAIDVYETEKKALKDFQKVG